MCLQNIGNSRFARLLFFCLLSWAQFYYFTSACNMCCYASRTIRLAMLYSPRARKMAPWLLRVRTPRHRRTPGWCVSLFGVGKQQGGRALTISLCNVGSARCRRRRAYAARTAGLGINKPGFRRLSCLWIPAACL